MRYLVRIFLVTIISAGVAWLLSMLPPLELTQTLKERVMTTFSMERQVVLADENLVDYLSRIPLHLRMDKVDWDHSVLYIDLIMSADDPAPHPRILDDLYEIAEFSLFGTENVKEVMLRVNEAPMEQAEAGSRTHSQEQLLLAVDARRGEITAEDIIQLRRSEGKVDPQSIKKFKMVFTDQWYEAAVR
ncbi:hypothetical protein SY83_18610 [Paenibacillus swuensis]|uniref:Uncharacterized protein n=1 Tax=Paenibacillus swuensis TaxID=1178515 RepID=A0A172TLP0_9BACL|nr:hypothetical protein [Paenibacillus swuensis]ANE47975.1 hypothetical protein SY83_18610 [Paenibacillus swuensis]